MDFDLDGTLVVPGGTRPVPGTADLLATLHARGVELAVATSAPTPVARRVLDDLGVAGLVGSVAGRGPDGVWSGKAGIVAEALLGLGRLLPDGAAGAVMVGDTEGDMAAAREHGLDAVGVGWGSAPASALRRAGALAVLREPGDLLLL